MKDFLDILKTHKYYRDGLWNKTDHTYTFETGSIIEFFSADQPSKVRGPRRDRLFINEANNIPYETFDQLEIRTKDFVIMDWNPVSEFWFDSEVKAKRNDVDFMILTYKDNEALSKEIVNSIEQRTGNKNWWKVYGLGHYGDAEGRIYKDWQVIDEIPHSARLERFGIDFGYTNDPTAIVAVYYYQGSYLLDEVCFLNGMSNKQISDSITNYYNYRPVLCVADSAEPKSIAEIKSYGLNIIPTPKGKDSVRNGIQDVQSQKISYTKTSLNLQKEYRNYMWEQDRDGRFMNIPEHFYSHSMDAVRYAIDSLVSKPKIFAQASPLK